jgi:hypothetical protein
MDAATFRVKLLTLIIILINFILFASVVSIYHKT